MTVQQAANIMGVSCQLVRYGLRQGKFPFGTAVKMSSRWTYYINEKQFKEYMGGKKDVLQ